MTISCTFANAEKTQVTLTDQQGRTFTVPVGWPGEFRMGNSVADILALLGKSEPDAYVAPPEPLRDIPRPSFLFMMSKMGITEAQVEGLIGQMTAGDARDLALIVFKNQQTFKRDNTLLKTLTAAAGLTDAQVDTAWRAAEQLIW